MSKKPTAHLSFSRKNLPQLMLQGRELVLSRFRPMLNEAGFTEQQWRIIRVLVEHGPLEPREIVQVCGISSPSLAGILARMDETGLVRRERMAQDQRRLLVSATASSRALAAKLAPRIEAVYAGLEADLGPRLTRQLYESLETLVERLGKTPSG
jgi:homoprotocatechuate degradation regulator HpaR